MIIKRKAQNLNTSLRPKLSLRNPAFCIKFFIALSLFETLSLGMKIFVCSNNGKSSKEKN